MMPRLFALLVLLVAATGFRAVRRNDVPPSREASLSAAEHAETGGRRRERRRREPRRREPRRRRSPSPEPSPEPTPPSPPSPPGACQDFLLLGDFGMGNSDQKRVAEGFAKVAAEVNPTAIMAMGDNLYSETSHSRMVSRWREVYVDKYKSLRRPWYGMMGNHDWNNGDARLEVSFAQSSKNNGSHWKTPGIYYKLRWATADGTTIDFFVIDTYLMDGKKEATKYESQSKHKKWLDSELGKSNADWKIILGHHPVYYWSKKKGSMGKSSRGGVTDMMKKYNVPLFLAGHHHHSELSTYDGFYCVTCGGGAMKKESKTISPKNGLLAYYYGGGFFGMKICDKNKVKLSIYNYEGKHRWSYDVPNKGSARSADVPNKRSAARSAANALPEDDIEGEESDSEVFAPYETGEGDAPVECNGVQLTSVDRVCAADMCTVTVEATWRETCAAYCARHSLSCKGGWTQDHEEDCTAVANLGCDGTQESGDNHMCQCA